MTQKRKVLVLSLTTTLILMILTACGEPAAISVPFYIINRTDVTITSLTLNVTGRGLPNPIQVNDSPIAAGETQEFVVSVPEKQAKKSDWVAYALTELGDDYSNPFEFGELINEDRSIKGFYVEWFDYPEKEHGGHYGVGVSSHELELGAEPAWWGEYECEDALLGIVNYDGAGFQFLFMGAAGSEYDGFAAIISDDGFMAEYGDLLFTLSSDSESITVELAPGGGEGSPYEAYCGEYYRY